MILGGFNYPSTLNGQLVDLFFKAGSKVAPTLSVNSKVSFKAI